MIVAGILGMHAIKDRAVVINGKIEIRPMMYVALTYDHRLVHTLSFTVIQRLMGVKLLRF